MVVFMVMMWFFVMFLVMQWLEFSPLVITVVLVATFISGFTYWVKKEVRCCSRRTSRAGRRTAARCCSKRCLTRCVRARARAECQDSCRGDGRGGGGAGREAGREGQVGGQGHRGQGRKGGEQKARAGKSRGQKGQVDWCQLRSQLTPLARTGVVPGAAAAVRPLYHVMEREAAAWKGGIGCAVVVARGLVLAIDTVPGGVYGRSDW